MKISLNWLKKYIHFGISAKELSHRLTLSGLEVEKEETIGTDTVFEFEITPNRPDCLSLLGIGRELSAILNKPLKKPFIKKFKLPKFASDIVIENSSDCARYIGVVLKNVKIARSPQEIKDNLSSLGIRSVNNVVDITNFCLMECGQPMHAFDYDKLSGGKIIVRRAKVGEKILAINDVEYALDPSILVIADARKAVAIAGIMGGKETEVTEKTKNVLLESAYFDPLLIRRSSRKLGLRSDASYRFERGVDMEMVEQGCWRAVGLLSDVAGAELFSFRDACKGKTKKQKAVEIVLDPQKASQFLGVDISAAQAKNILTKLECKVVLAAKGRLKVVPPSFRADIKADIDVIEELGRIMGFDQLPSRLAAINPVNMETDQKRRFKEKLSTLLVAQGYSEIISYTTLSRADLVKAKVPQAELVYNQNFLSEDQEVLRPSCLPSMLNVIARNFKNGQKNLRFFEVGKIYLPSGEKDVFVLGLTGAHAHDWRTPQARRVDFYDIKGIVENITQALKRENVFVSQVNNASLDKEESAQLLLEGKVIGFLGKIQKDILVQWDIKHQDVYFAQVLIDALCQQDAKSTSAYAPLDAYPSVVRDVSLAIKKEISYQNIKDCIKELCEPLLQKVDFVEQYLGDKIPSGQRGITISLVYQSPEKTLTDQEAEEAHQRICHKILNDFQAVKR
ncbi:MAG: phenylalanine--tRNA ligase subunit beta [Candidatus Omnitrophota bacterium]